MLDMIRKKLALRLIMALVSISSAVAVCLIGYFYYSNRTILYNELMEDANIILLYSAKSYDVPLWEFSKKMINDLDEALLLNKIIVAVNVQSQFNYVAGRMKIDFKDPRSKTVELNEPYRLDENKRDVKMIFVPIFHEGNEIGRFELFYTDYFVRQEIMSRLIKMLLILSILSVVVVSFLYRVLRESFIGPVLKLASVSQQIADNYDFSIMVDNDSQDEIGVLYRGFNNMLENINLRDTERRRAEEKIEASLREKEMLLKEIHHRVKNNLQIISSLINLQYRRIDDERIQEVLQESQNRIAAIASVHSLLYRSQNLAVINFKDYLQEMTSHIFQSYKAGTAAISLVVDAENIMLPIDKAMPLGLIINEMFTNALKYAFPDGRQGIIKIDMNQTGKELKLIFKDNGIGCPQDVVLSSSKTFGLELVQMLVEQLDGSIEQFIDGGTKYVIILKIDE